MLSKSTESGRRVQLLRKLLLPRLSLTSETGTLRGLSTVVTRTHLMSLSEIVLHGLTATGWTPCGDVHCCRHAGILLAGSRLQQSTRAENKTLAVRKGVSLVNDRFSASDRTSDKLEKERNLRAGQNL